MKRDILIIKYYVNTALSRWIHQAKNCFNHHALSLIYSYAQAIVNLFPSASIESEPYIVSISE